MSIQIDFNDNKMELCLCSRCLSDFYATNQYIIKRADANQFEKDICSFCNTRRGFDYIVENKKICDLNNRTFEEQGENE